MDVSVPADVYDAVASEADADEFSINREVLALLREALAARYAARAKRRRT